MRRTTVPARDGTGTALSRTGASIRHCSFDTEGWSAASTSNPADFNRVRHSSGTRAVCDGASSRAAGRGAVSAGPGGTAGEGSFSGRGGGRGGGDPAVPMSVAITKRAAAMSPERTLNPSQRAGPTRQPRRGLRAGIARRWPLARGRAFQSPTFPDIMTLMDTLGCQP